MVGEIKVFISPAVVDYLDTLVYQLYKKEYFGFLSTAEEYVVSIYDVINSNIHLNNKPTPEKLLYLGSNYIFLSQIKEPLGLFSSRKKILLI
jgi:hypothetical protein